MKNDKQRCGTRRYHQSEMKNPTTLISGTVTPKWTVPGERNLQVIGIIFIIMKINYDYLFIIKIILITYLYILIFYLQVQLIFDRNGTRIYAIRIVEFHTTVYHVSQVCFDFAVEYLLTVDDNSHSFIHIH